MRCLGVSSSLFKVHKAFYCIAGLVTIGLVFFTTTHSKVHEHINFYPAADGGGDVEPRAAFRNRTGDAPVSNTRGIDAGPSLGDHDVNDPREPYDKKSESAAPPSTIKLNLPIDIEERVPSVDELYERIAIVSAFSQNHYLEARAFIASAQRTMPDKKIVIYDLGIQQSTLPKVRQLCNVEVRPFPWSSYPAHVKSLHNYAWKPILIDITLREFGAIFWGDASVRFKKSLKHLLSYSTEHHGYMSHWHSFDPKEKTEVKHQYYYTHAKMYAHLGVDRQKYYDSDNLAAYPAANRQLYVNSSVIQRQIVQPMLECALRLRCISPEGAKLGAHRHVN